MTKLLLKLFIKNSDDTQNSEVREGYGKLGSTVGIIVNFILFLSKFIVGTIFNSVSITADAVNNLSDSGSSIISLISFKISNKPADKKHPFGHARIEYIASLIVSFIILSFGFQIIKTSFLKILNPGEISFGILSVVVLGLSILTKMWLYVFNKNLGKKINSTVMQATATDSLSDVLATSAVLISTVVSPIIGFQLDGYMGIGVACFIILAGIKIIQETFDHLLGEAPDEEFTDTIDKFINKYDGVLGTHDLVVHNYGPQRCFSSVHVEVAAHEDIMESHDLIDNIEKDIAQELNIHLVIHLDPIVTDNEYINELRVLTKQIVKQIGESLSVHDFRAVIGTTHTNLIFDVAVPFEFKKSNAYIVSKIKDEIRLYDDKLFAVVTIDRT